VYKRTEELELCAGRKVKTDKFYLKVDIDHKSFHKENLQV